MKDVIITTFGDMMRIPYKDTSLLHEKALGSDIRIIYSPLESVQIAQENPSKKVVFLSVGFETTTPVIALSAIEALEKGITNYMLLTANKTIPEVMRLLSSDKEISVDGYIYPGHVGAIIGTSLFEELAQKHNIPGAIAGFEPVDILGAIYRTAANINNNEIKVENLYSRVVATEGNKAAREKINVVFEECAAIWRGIGCIPKSGLKLKNKYKQLDAWQQFGIKEDHKESEPVGCRCGDILKGKCLPNQCKLYGTVCTPENPIGSCMVSTEGTCAAYYKYS
jgi:hydrogenase expression/formation protein HypD